MIKIAVLMLTRNSGEWLDKVLTPLHAQQGKYDVNLVLVDGYSTDGTLAKAKKYFPNLILAESKSRNLSTLRMQALEAAKSLHPTYMSFIDSDVQVPLDFFDRMTLLLQRPEVGIAGLRFELEEDPPKHFVSKFYRDRKDIIRKGIYETDYTTTACSMWKAKLTENFTLDSRFKRAGEDVDFNLQIVEQGYKAVVDANNPPAWHIRHATIREELHRVKDHGLARALNLMLHPKTVNRQRYYKTYLAALLILFSWVALALTPFVGLVGLVPFGLFYFRHWLKCRDKKRLDYAFFGFLMSVIFFTRFCQGYIQYRSTQK